MLLTIKLEAKHDFDLGECYYNGERVAQDYKKAVNCFRKAAQKGNANAQNYLGICYYNGHGVAKDLKEALKWWTAAAEQGNAEAQDNLNIIKNID